MTASQLLLRPLTEDDIPTIFLSHPIPKLPGLCAFPHTKAYRRRKIYTRNIRLPVITDI